MTKTKEADRPRILIRSLEETQEKVSSSSDREVFFNELRAKIEVEGSWPKRGLEILSALARERSVNGSCGGSGEPFLEGEEPRQLVGHALEHLSLCGAKRRLLTDPNLEKGEVGGLTFWPPEQEIVLVSRASGRPGLKVPKDILEESLEAALREIAEVLEKE